jgi:hypothetical protein
VVRLGRGIQTQTAGTPPDSVDHDPSDAVVESESGSGLTAIGPDSDDHRGPSPDRRTGPDATATGHGPDCFDLIITAAEPRTLDGLDLTDWTGLLTPTGVLAVITHGDRSGDRFTDPAGPLVCSAHHAGLRYLDRIALLTVPVADGALAVTRPATGDRSPTPPTLSTTSIRHTPVHDDLLVFTRQPAAAGATKGEETSDD